MPIKLVKALTGKMSSPHPQNDLKFGENHIRIGAEDTDGMSEDERDAMKYEM